MLFLAKCWIGRIEVPVFFGDAGAVLMQACDIVEDGLFGFTCIVMVMVKGTRTSIHHKEELHYYVLIIFGLALTKWFPLSRHLISTFKENETDDDASSGNHFASSFPPKRSSYSYLQMNGREIFKFSVRVVPQSIEAALGKAGLASSNFDWLLLHQKTKVIYRYVNANECAIERHGQIANRRTQRAPISATEVARQACFGQRHMLLPDFGCLHVCLCNTQM
ncbi:hypothetical protein HAX54_000331 [Datura stramonium]|uniref:Uncharacterized protein n=1 Tax=Datura stramonium TaxID=4076 RepID=A0ABS8T2U3_DATST|nr:hypothetical protein [Datura stramonium]